MYRINTKLKYSTAVLSVILMMFLLQGCGAGGNKAADTGALEIKKNREVVHTIIEEFGEDYYDLDELTAKTADLVNQYNEAADSKRIQLGNVELKDGILHMTMTFRRPEDYSSFYQQALFAGTVKDAYNAGYDLDIELNSFTEDEAVIGKEELLSMGEKRIIIIREAVTIRVSGEILYASADVEQGSNGKEAVITNGNNLSFIVYK